MPVTQEEKEIKKVPYIDEEIAYRGKIIRRLERAKRQRDATHPELDDMDYLTYYETNAKAANSYIPPKENKDDKNTAPATEESIVKEEMIHYARLVELKHKELKVIEKDEPLLYKQFASDVNNLDSVYHSLQQQLPKNPNKEQLLEAMLQNLQLQMGLLNHQLDIIKQINHSKQKAYEKAYKTI